MPDAKSGSPGTLVPPADPDPAHDADVANPGTVEQIKENQRQSGTGKYGTQPVEPYKPPTSKPGDPPPDPAKKNGWIEVLLVDEDGDPVPGQKYSITLPNNQVSEGTLGADGLVRIDGIDPEGNCKIQFPDIDGKAWSPA